MKAHVNKSVDGGTNRGEGKAQGSIKILGKGGVQSVQTAKGHRRKRREKFKVEKGEKETVSGMRQGED